MDKKYKLALSTASDASITAPILLVGSIIDNIKKASKLGYDAIEIHLRENSVIDFDEILKQCQYYNVKIATIVTGRLHTQENITMTDCNQEDIDRVLVGLKKYIEIAEKFGADIVLGWIRGNVLENQSKDDFNRIFGENMKVVSEYAFQRNVKVFIEAINRYEINSMNNASQILEMINKYALKNTYVHLDTFHMNIEEANMVEAITLCGDKLGYMHFADSNRNYPGSGHIDFGEILMALNKINYKGLLSVECIPIPTREIAAKEARKNLLSAISSLD